MSPIAAATFTDLNLSVTIMVSLSARYRSEDKKPLSWRSLPRKHGKTLFNTLTSLHKTLEKSE